MCVFYSAVTLTTFQQMNEEIFSELHQTALDYASDGIPIFVCKPNSKLPATPNGFKDATTDVAVINKWFAECADYNIALSPEDAGWGVVDVEAEGLADWEKYEVARTFTNGTPRGGKHFFFKGSLPSKVRFLNGYAFDTRGRGGYVLIPPSVVNGNPYVNLDDCELAGIPQFVIDCLSERKHEKQLAPEGIDFDTPTNLAPAKDWLSRQKPPVEGERDNKTFFAAVHLKDLGLSPPTILELLRGWETTLSDADHERIVDSAFKNGQNAPGCDATKPMDEVFKNVEAEASPTALGLYDLEDDARMDTTPIATFLFDKVLPERGSVLVFGPTRQYKSFLLLDLAMALATGLEGWGIKPTRSGPVIYSALEGRESLKRDRRRAWRLAKGIEGTTEFYVNRAPMIKQPGAADAYIAALETGLKGKLPVAIFLETAAKMMVGLDPTRDVPLLVAFIDRLVEHFKCVVVCSHHTGNNVEMGPKDSSTYMQAFDTVISVMSPGKLLASAKIEKHKDCEEAETPFTFQGHKIGGSLVFQRTSTQEHKTLTKKEDAFAPALVGTALKKLKAVGTDYAVDTKALAAELVPFLENDTIEEHDVRIAEAAHRLRKLSANLLEAYKAPGKGLKWCMPG